MSAIELRAPALTGRIDQIARDVWRIVAPNPSALTGPGTNTYVLGRERRIVIDPGPDDPRHLKAILEVAGDQVDEILCTHSHTDHSPGAAPLKALTGAPVRGLPPPDDGYQDRSYAPDAGIADGERFAVDGAVLRAVHTPGHASNHVCFLLEAERMLFTGDHLMSGSTVVILPPDGSMRLYVDSLRHLLTLSIDLLAPGHGAVIEDAKIDIERVIAHRLTREAKVVGALQARGRCRLDDVLPIVYDDTPRALHSLARFSLLAHAQKLEQEGRVTRDGDLWTWRGD